MVLSTEGQGDEGASLEVPDVHSGFCRGFFTILDNVLNGGEPAGGKERAAWPHPHPGNLLEGLGGGARNSAAADLANVLRR
jgi:hypothetical protein